MKVYSISQIIIESIDIQVFLQLDNLNRLRLRVLRNVSGNPLLLVKTGLVFLPKLGLGSIHGLLPLLKILLDLGITVFMVLHADFVGLFLSIST